MSDECENLKEKIAEKRLFIFNAQNALDRAVREKEALQRELNLYECSNIRLLFNQFDEKYKSVAKDEDGTWWLYRDVPIRLDNAWISPASEIELSSENAAHLPRNVNWKDSLMVRET